MMVVVDCEGEVGPSYALLSLGLCIIPLLP